jgi:hypothetical protein
MHGIVHSTKTGSVAEYLGGGGLMPRINDCLTYNAAIRLGISLRSGEYNYLIRCAVSLLAKYF